MAALGLLVFGGSLILLYAGFTGAPLVASLESALKGKPLPKGQPIGVASGTGSGQNPGPVTAGPQGHNDVPGAAPLTGPGSVAPSPSGQIGVDPITGQPIFSA